MIVQKQFLNKLKDFGLNTYESKLWTALLSRGVSTAGELSDIASVPRSRTYDVLESLEKKGFILMKIGKPIKYLAVPPEEVLERVKKRVRENAETQSKLLESLKSSEILSELSTLHTQGIEFIEPTDLTGSLKGRNSLYNHLEMMIKNAKTSVSIMTTTQGLVRKAEALTSALKKAKEHGVKIRIAAPLSPETKQATQLLKGLAEVRHISGLRSRFCVVDEKEISFALLDDKEVHANYDSGVWVSTGFFAQALQQFFDREWKNLKPADSVSK